MARVTVPQEDGEIVVAHQGNEPVTYDVESHHVDVDEADLEVFLHAVPGAELASGSAAAGKARHAGGSPAATKED